MAVSARGAIGTASKGMALAACAAGSALLHAGVLLAGVMAADPPGPHRPAHAHAGHRGPSAVAVRLETDFERLPATAAGPVRDSHAPPTPTQPPRPQPVPALRHAGESGHPSSPPAAVAAAEEVNPRVREDDGAASEQADAPYLPRSALSLGPAPQDAIDLPYPDLAPWGRFRAVLTLFIDEQGVVQRVRFDEAGDTGLPPVLEDSARQTFLRSPFTPGQVAGRPVRSQLRIEVEFTAETLGEPEPEPPAQTSASTRK